MGVDKGMWHMYIAALKTKLGDPLSEEHHVKLDSVVCKSANLQVQLKPAELCTYVLEHPHPEGRVKNMSEMAGALSALWRQDIFGPIPKKGVYQALQNTILAWISPR